jgi:hypothetical protein
MPIGSLPITDAANTCRISRGSSSAAYRAKEIIVLQLRRAAIVARRRMMLRCSIKTVAPLFHVKLRDR